PFQEHFDLPGFSRRQLELLADRAGLPLAEGARVEIERDGLLNRGGVSQLDRVARCGRRRPDVREGVGLEIDLDRRPLQRDPEKVDPAWQAGAVLAVLDRVRVAAEGAD